MTRRSLLRRFAAFLSAALIPKAIADAAIVTIAKPIPGEGGKYEGAIQNTSCDHEVVEKVFRKDEGDGTVTIWAHCRTMTYDDKGHLVDVSARETRRIA